MSVLRINEASATNATATATIPAIDPHQGGGHLFADGFIISMSAAVTTASQASFTGADTGAFHVNVPVGCIKPIVCFFPDGKSLRMSPNTAFVGVLPALGTGVIGTITLFGHGL